MQRAENCHLSLLDRESLTNVCSLLDPVTLANFSCTSRALRDVCFQNCLWERLSRCRWQHTNAYLYGRAEDLVGCQQGRYPAQKTPSTQHIREPSVDFRSLYANNNGWTPFHLQETYQHTLASETSWEFCVSRAPASHFCSGAGDALYTVDTRVQLWSTGDGSQVVSTLIAEGSHNFSAEAVSPEVLSITELTAGIVATGDFAGKICLHDLRPDAAASASPGATWHNGKRCDTTTLLTKLLQRHCYMMFHPKLYQVSTVASGANSCVTPSRFTPRCFTVTSIRCQQLHQGAKGVGHSTATEQSQHSTA